LKAKRKTHNLAHFHTPVFAHVGRKKTSVPRSSKGMAMDAIKG